MVETAKHFIEIYKTFQKINYIFEIFVLERNKKNTQKKLFTRFFSFDRTFKFSTIEDVH